MAMETVTVSASHVRFAVKTVGRGWQRRDSHGREVIYKGSSRNLGLTQKDLPGAPRARKRGQRRRQCSARVSGEQAPANKHACGREGYSPWGLTCLLQSSTRWAQRWTLLVRKQTHLSQRRVRVRGWAPGSQRTLWSRSMRTWMRKTAVTTREDFALAGAQAR